MILLTKIGKVKFIDRGAKMKSDALKKAQAKYEEKIKAYHFRLLQELDKELIDHLDKVPNKNAYIKELIRQDIQRQG